MRSLAAAGTAALALLALAGCVAGCSSPAHRLSPAAAASRAAARASRKLTLEAEGRTPAVTIGLTAGPADAAGLVALGAGYLTRNLPAGVAVRPDAFPTAAAEAAALAAGQLDAAYVSPVTAVRLWQSSGGKLLTVISGAASRRPARSAALLVASRAFLAAHPSLADGVLKGQIQASDLLVTDRPQALADLASELRALTGAATGERRLARAVSGYAYTCDPLAASVLAQARAAAAAGRLRPPGSLAGLYQLGPLNTLLRAAGQRPVVG